MNTKWVVSKHAKHRATQRFGVKPKEAVNWINQKMENAVYITDTVDDKGKPSRLFASNGVNIIAHINSDVILTVMEPRRLTEVNRKLSNFARSELAKQERKKMSELRRIERLKSEIEQEIGLTREKLIRARSLPTKIACRARIKALKTRYDELPNESHEVKRVYLRKALAFSKVI